MNVREQRDAQKEESKPLCVVGRNGAEYLKDLKKGVWRKRNDQAAANGVASKRHQQTHVAFSQAAGADSGPKQFKQKYSIQLTRGIDGRATRNAGEANRGAAGDELAFDYPPIKADGEPLTLQKTVSLEMQHQAMQRDHDGQIEL